MEPVVIIGIIAIILICCGCVCCMSTGGAAAFYSWRSTDDRDGEEEEYVESDLDDISEDESDDDEVEEPPPDDRATQIDLVDDVKGTLSSMKRWKPSSGTIVQFMSEDAGYLSWDGGLHVGLTPSRWLINVLEEAHTISSGGHVSTPLWFELVNDHSDTIKTVKIWNPATGAGLIGQNGSDVVEKASGATLWAAIKSSAI